MRELELYVHIPFCMKKCAYCDFLSAPADEKEQRAYMEGLLRETAYYGPAFRDALISTIYIGGGTPSWLQEDYIAALMKEIYRDFRVAEDAEITIECNPGTLTRTKLEYYKMSGINRLSIGLQSVHDDELKHLGRVHTFEQFLRNFGLARECGFYNINVDLMNALPWQTVEKAYESLIKVIQLKPEHISSYSLMIEKGTPFYDLYKFDMVKLEAGMPPEDLPSEDTTYQIGVMTQDVLAQNGYERYEISNYARKGCACRHNIGYWQRKEYLGLGLGAASLLGEVRYSNVRDLEQYIELSYDCTNLREEVTPLSRNTQIEEFMFLGLRMIEGIDKNRFYRTFGFTVGQIYGNVIQELAAEDLICNTPTRLYLTDRGIDLSNYVLAQFLF